MACAWAAFLRERKAKLAAKTLAEFEGLYRRLVEAIGDDRTLQDLDRATLVSLRDTWATESANGSKGADGRAIATATLEKRMVMLGTFLRWVSFR